MEPTIPLKLKFVRNSNCFVGLHNHAWIKLGLTRGDSPTVVSLQHFDSEYKWHFTVDPSPLQNLSSDELVINGQFGYNLNLKKDEFVLVSRYQGNLPMAKRVWAEPNRVSDWEIIESNSSSVEAEVLNQLRVVQVGLNPVLFVGNVPVSLKIREIEPSSEIVLMTKDTEVMIEPKARPTANLPRVAASIERSNIQTHQGNTPRSVMTRIKYIFSSSVEDLEDTTQIMTQTWTQVPIFKNSFGAIRIREDVCNHHLCCFMSSADIETGDKALISLKYLDSNLDDGCDGNDLENSQLLMAHIDCNDRIPKGNVAFSPPLMKSLGLKVGDRLEIGQGDISKVSVADDTFRISATEGKELNLCESESFVVVPNMSLNLVINNTTSCKLEPSGNAHFIIQKDLKKHIRYTMDKPPFSIEVDDRKCILEGTKAVIDEILLAKKKRRATSILFVGDLGFGKSHGLKMIVEELATSNVYGRIIKCTSLIGKKPDIIFKALNSALKECLYHGDSILILDDLDAIAKNIEETTSVEGKNHNLHIRHIIQKIIENANRIVGLVATARSKDSLNSQLLKSRRVSSSKTFDKVIDLGKPNDEERMVILSNFMNNRFSKTLSEVKSKVVKSTIGFSPNDLKRLAVKLSNHCSAEELLKVVGEMKPIMMKSDTNCEQGGKRWCDIGGMDSLKSKLEEIVVWPSKYSKIYEKFPLRLRSGVLLYGAPGCGKTLLVESLCREFNFNIIKVKGPELLSKYIGESEAAVRNLFHKAKTISDASGGKVTVIFFDEFDSLGPRRGHDSTGVTDRVVNQLLTQLDGVEGPSTSQLFVVAATSRPDIIDPALLRPGRLDSLLYCPLPDEVGRRNILSIIIKKTFDVTLNGCELDELAKSTDGFTGADIEAAIYTAQLNHVKAGTKPVITPENRQARETYILKGDLNWEIQTLGNASSTSYRRMAGITLDDIRKAVDDTKISVSSKDRDIYSNVYKKIQTSSDHYGTFPGVKVTLA